MIQVTDQRYLDQINEPFRGSFSAEVKLFFKGGTRTFTDDDIFTISENETANIVADENPTQSTEITLSNYNHEFDINGTSGYFRDIADGIECQYRFGFHVIDEDGSDDIVWLDWKRRWCSGEASLAEKQVTFTVADVFSTNDDDIEGYMSSNYGLVVTNVFNKSTYPQQENGIIGVDFDTDLTNTVMYYQPTYTSFNEIIQSVAFASGKQFYIDHKGVVHIDDDRTTPTGVHLGIGDYFEDNEAGKEKKVKKITVSYYVPEDSTVDPRPDFVRAMNGTGESVTVSNDFICSLEDGNRVMSYLVNYYEKRGTFECTFRGDPRLEPLDVITIDILNSDETVQTVTGTIISVENTYDGTFESTIECRYVTSDTTDDTASITGAENFVYPLDSNTPNPTSVTLTCTTSINNPTKYVWEYYNMVTSAWTQIGTSSTLTIPYNTEWLSDDVTTTFRCTVNDSVSASVGIKRVYTHATYTYLGIQQTAPSNPTTGDYYLAPSGLVYLWNGQAWVTTTRSDLLINAVADGKTLTGIESTPLGQLIASMQGADGQPGADGKPGADGAPAKSLTLFADTYSFHTDAEGNVKPDQTITLTVQKQNVSDDIVWTDNKNINVPTNTLTYEFKSTIKGGTSQVTLPENLLADCVPYVAGSPEPPTSNTYYANADGTIFVATDASTSGTCVVTDGMASFDGSSDSMLTTLPNGTYNYGFMGAQYILFDITPPLHRYYIRLESEDNFLNAALLNNDNSGGTNSSEAIISKLSHTGNIYSVCGIPYGYSDGTTPVYVLYYALGKNGETPVTSATCRNPVVVDITANQDFFTSQGLTTESEIQAYLDGIAFEDFGKPIATETTNPALDGTPTVFTVTAGDLSSSVKIGYVQDGQQGTDGAPAKSLILTADSYNFHTDSEGNVKPDQTITITVQKQNVLDDIVWSDNKSINVPVNAMTYEFKSSVGESKFVPANLLAGCTPIKVNDDNVDIEAAGNTYYANDDGSVTLVQGETRQITIKDGMADGLHIDLEDGTYYLRSCSSMIILNNIIPPLHKYYVRMESTDNFTAISLFSTDGTTICAPVVKHTGNVYSNYGIPYGYSDSQLLLPIYLIQGMLGKTESEIPTSPRLINPVVVDITANQGIFTKLGITTDSKIQAYLDTISYEDFTTPKYEEIQIPENIAKNIVFNTSVGEAGKIVSSNPNPMDGGDVNTTHGDLSEQLATYTVIDSRGDYSTYDYVASGTIGMIADASLVNFSHTVYMRMSPRQSEFDGIMQMVVTSDNQGGNIGNAVLFDFKKVSNTYVSTIGNASLSPSSGGFYTFFFTLPYAEKTTSINITKFYITDFVIIDIDNNRESFNKLGLSSDNDIRDFLDSLDYDVFGMLAKNEIVSDSSSSITAINPALDGTPTIFTITAGDLSDSVQIGYVQDGNQGEAGNSIERIDTFYLATSQGSGVTIETEGWTKEPQTITPEKKYLWIYQDIYYTDDSFERTDPYISGVYGDKGDPGEGGTPSMVTLVPSSVTYELSSRNVIQKQQVITVEARVSGGTGTPTWTITPTEADGYTTGKDTNTITITLPVGSSLTGFSVSANVTGIGEDVVYINGTPVGEPTIRFFEQRASAPTRSDNNGEPFITGDYYVTNDGVPMMYEEISNSWRQPNNGDKYYDQIMTNIGNWWLSKGNDITTTTAALYGYFRTIYSNNAIIDQLSVAGIRLQEGGIIQSTVTLPDGTVRGYEPGDGETYGTTGFYLSADGTAEFYNMSAFGIFAKGSFQADAMVTGEGTSAITQSNLYAKDQPDWVSQRSYQQTTETSSYSIGDVYSMNISPDDTYAFWTSVSFSASYKRVYAYAMGIGDTVVSATQLTGIENAIEGLSSTNYESVSRSVAIRRNGNGYQAVVAGGVSSNYTQRITVIDTTSASATATTHEYTKTNNPVQFGTIPIFTDTQLLLYNAGSGVDLSSFGRYAEYQIGIADLQSDGGNYSFSWGTSSAQSGKALWGKGTEFEISAIQNNSSIGGVYDAVNGRVWIWLVGNGKMFPTEFKSTNWRQGARFRQNDYTWDGTTPVEDDFNDIKTSTYNDYIATDNGMTVITYGNNTAWEIIEINENDAWSMRSYDFGSTRYGFMGWDGTYIYGKNLSTNRMYRGTKNEWGNGTQTSLGYTISSNIVGKYLVDGDILSWSSNVKRTTHGQRMDNIISFFSQILPKINPSTMSHMPESEPLASVTACTGNVRIAGVNRTIVRMGCSSSTLTIDTNNGSYVYKSGVLYDDTETVEITSLTISAKAASVNTKDILPQSNNTYDIGSSSRIYRTIYCTTLFANQLGSGSDKVYRIYADYIGEQSNKTTTIYTTNLYLGSYSSGTTGYTPLPNRLLLQWGIQNRTGTGTGGAWVNVSFPRSFGTVYGVMANRICNSNSYADSYVGYLNYSATNSGFTYRKRPVDTMYWLAIGSS